MKKATILLVLVAVIVITYYNLGGGKELSFSIVEKGEIAIKGQLFKGRYNDEQLEELFYITKAKVDSAAGRHMAVVNYPAGKDSLKQFIGVLSNTNKDSLEGWEHQIFSYPRFIFAKIEAHNVVMPKPEDVRSQAELFARDNNLKLDEISIEIYKSERELEVYFPVVK